MARRSTAPAARGELTLGALAHHTDDLEPAVAAGAASQQVEDLMYPAIRTRRPNRGFVRPTMQSLSGSDHGDVDAPALSESDHTRPRMSGIFKVASSGALIR